MHYFAVVVVVAAVDDAAFVRCSFFFSLIVRMSVSRRLTLLRIHSIVNSQLEWTTAFGWTPPSLVFMYSELVGTSLKNGIAQRYHSHVFRFILFVLALHLAKRWKNSWFFLTKFKESKPFSMHFILVYHSVIATANISDRCKSMIWPFILLKMLNHKRASEWKKNYCVCVCVWWISCISRYSQHNTIVMKTMPIERKNKMRAKRTRIYFYLWNLLINYLKHVRTLPFLLALSNCLCGKQNNFQWFFFHVGFVFMMIAYKRDIRNANTWNGNTMPWNTRKHIKCVRYINCSVFFVAVVSCWHCSFFGLTVFKIHHF